MRSKVITSVSNAKTDIMSGGGTTISVSDLSEKLNIAGGDVDFDLLDN